MADAVAVLTPGQRITSTTGVPVTGGSIEFYDASSNNAKLVYADAGLTVSLGAIVYTDAAGYPVTAQNGTQKTLIYTGSSDYKLIIKDGSGVEVASHSIVKGAVIPGTSGGGGGITQDAADARYVRNPNALPATTSFDDGDTMSIFETAIPGNAGMTGAAFRTDLLTRWRTAGYVFDVGVRMPFQQTTPPVGWTKETAAAYNDAVTKFTTGTVATGGTQGFATVFASQTFTGTVGSDTPSIAKTASHDHTYTFKSVTGGASGGGDPNSLTNVSQNTGLTGGGTAHSHTLTMNAFNMAVKFAELSIGVKS